MNTFTSRIFYHTKNKIHDYKVLDEEKKRRDEGGVVGGQGGGRGWGRVIKRR